jgi:hypothetical protein
MGSGAKGYLLWTLLSSVTVEPRLDERTKAHTVHMQSTWILAASLLWAATCSSPRRDAPGGSHFVVLGDAVARDTRTGLEWTRRDDGEGLDWHKAEAYCQALKIDETGAWRLPGIEELRGLYGVTPLRPCGDAMCAIDPVFTLTSPWVWSATAPDPTSRAYLDFQSGQRFFPGITPRLVRRVLCVRTSAAGAMKERREGLRITKWRSGSRGRRKTREFRERG